METTRRDFIKMGIIAASVPNIVCGIEKIVNQDQKIQKQEPKQISTLELIKKATLEDCASFVQECKNNTPFKQQIKKYGFDKTAEHLTKIKSYSIDLADKYKDSDCEISEKEYLSISKQIGLEQIKFRKGHTNPIDSRVIRARVKALEIVVKKHRKVLGEIKDYKNENVQGQYFELIRENFTEKEYTKYCQEISNAMDNYYNALGKTLGLKIIFGWGDIKKMKKASRKHYFAIRDNIYSKND